MAAEKKCVGHGHHEDVPNDLRAASQIPVGIEPCDLCGVIVQRKGDHYGVHFSTLSAMKPCPRSWPPPAVRSK